MRNKNMSRSFVCTMAFFTLAACSESNTDAPTESGVTISGKFANSSSSLSVGALAIDDYRVNCVSFDESPVSQSSDVSADGSFSLLMPSGVPFGCFVLDSDNAPVASIIKAADTGGGYSSNESSSFSLDSNVDFGDLDLDLETGKVSVPATRFAGAETPPPTDQLDLDDLHDQVFNLECISTGNSIYDEACDEFVADSPQVYFRIFKGSTGQEDIRGIGVWASEAEFDNCGSIDMNSQEKADIESEFSMTFSQLVDATGYVNGGACEKRDAGEDPSMENIDAYYANGPLLPIGGGWTLLTEHSNQSGGCSMSDSLSVSFRNGSGSNLVGNFSTKEHYSEANQGDCGSSQSFQAQFPVRFVAQ